MTDLDLSPDVLVVGGGLAGAVAAARAREAGARVLLVHRQGGGTAVSSGAIDAGDDLAGLVPGPALDVLERGGRWRRSVDLVAAQRPRHPYARANERGRERLREALRLLRELVAPAVHLVERDDGGNHVVATQLGTVKRAALVQRSQHLDLAALSPDDLVGIVEPGDLAGFSARSVSDMLSWVLGLAPARALAAGRVQLTSIVVDRTLPGQQVHGSSLEMAARLDHAEPRAAFVQALAAAVRAHPRAPTHLLIPPVLGVDHGAVVLEDLEAACGRPVRELLALPPSPPGARLQRALLAGLKRRGVRLVEGAASQARSADGRVASVVVEGRQVRLELSPGAVVLAAGRFFGGGIVRDHVAREPLLGLPVVTAGSLVGDSFIGDHLADAPEGAHDIFRAGVAVDDQMRPVDGAGRVILENVACAGTVVEGWDPARDGTGGGVAALTGFLAGDTAARHTRRQKGEEAA